MNQPIIDSSQLLWSQHMVESEVLLKLKCPLLPQLHNINYSKQQNSKGNILYFFMNFGQLILQWFWSQFSPVKLVSADQSLQASTDCGPL